MSGRVLARNYVAAHASRRFQLRGTFLRRLRPAKSSRSPTRLRDRDRSVHVDSLNRARMSPSGVAPPAVCSRAPPLGPWRPGPRASSPTRGAAGELGITQIVVVANGQAISGRFSLTRHSGPTSTPTPSHCCRSTVAVWRRSLPARLFVASYGRRIVILPFAGEERTTVSLPPGHRTHTATGCFPSSTPSTWIAPSWDQ